MLSIDVAKHLDSSTEMVKQELEQKWMYFGRKRDVGSNEAGVEGVSR